MAAIRCVLFDLDGTLIDTNDLIIASFQHTFRTYLGREWNEAEICTWFGVPLEKSLAETLPEVPLAEALLTYRTHNQAHHDQLTKPFPGVAAGLRELKAAGLSLGVVTSKGEAMAQRGLKLFGLDPYVDLLVGVESTRVHKPDPGPVLHALERLGFAPGPQAIMVGDSHFDLQAGRRAGVRTAAVAWSTLPHGLLQAEEPDFWAPTFGDLVRYCLASAGDCLSGLEQ